MFKKITIVTALAFISVTPMISQTLSIGPVVGLNVSKFTANTASENLVGMSIGALANYSIDEHVGLSAKLLFSQLGSKYTNSSTITKLNYLQMPISLVYYFGDAGNKFRPKIYAGPYFGTLLGARDENKNEIVDGAGNGPFKKHDIGGQFGLGFNYLLKSRTWLNVDLGYGGSFTDITISDATTEHNSAITAKIGISYPIGPR
jgi:Outer membrane protein beta-barrel domain